MCERQIALALKRRKYVPQYILSTLDHQHPPSSDDNPNQSPHGYTKVLQYDIAFLKQLDVFSVPSYHNLDLSPD